MMLPLLLAAAPLLQFSDSTFTILQITDMHLMPESSLCTVTEQTIRDVVAREQPQMAVLTGDIVTCSPTYKGWQQVIDLFNDLRLPFAVMPGNHDGEYVAKPELYDFLTESSPWYVGSTGPRGNGDSAIEVIGSDGNPAALIYCIDSNDYQPNQLLGSYDWIHFDQIEWYRDTSAGYTLRNDGKPLPALAFFHIPLIEYAEIADSPATYGNRLEGAGAPGGLNSGMFAAIIEMGDVMGVFVGHDHDNDYVGITKGIALGFGRVAGAEAYGELERGGRMIKLFEGKRKFDTWIATPSGNEPGFYYPSGLNGVEEAEMTYIEAPLKRDSRNKLKYGVAFEYYEGLIKHTSQIDTTTLVRRGVIENFDITGADSEDHFGYKFHTLIDIPERGVYTFYTYSDDGSVVQIDGITVVDNDSGHSVRYRDGKIALEPGLHRLDLLYFENYMGQELEVGYSSRDIDPQTIPSSVLYIPE